MSIAAKLIREARRAVGMSQDELARRSQTSQSAVAAYESAAKVPTAATLDRLLRAAGVGIGTYPLPRSRRSGSVRKLLQDHREEIVETAGRHGARNVRVFGSLARGEERQGSDIDLLVDMDRGYSLLDHVRLRRALNELLGVEVDVITTGGLLERDTSILEEATPI